jgi:hypothetical protein
VDVLAFLMPRDGVRNLRSGEVIPVSLDAGFDLLGDLDLDWIWVYESIGEIKGVLVASRCHGVAFIWRLAILPGQPHSVVIRLLRKFLHDLRERGIQGYMTLIDDSIPRQAKLLRIFEKAGGKTICTMKFLASGLPREGI